jgi:hypothetical protein
MVVGGWEVYLPFPTVLILLKLMIDDLSLDNCNHTSSAFEQASLAHRHISCSARDWDRIRITWGNPQSGCSDICSYSKRATIGVRAPYATRRKLQYEANQVHSKKFT